MPPAAAAAAASGGAAAVAAGGGGGAGGLSTPVTRATILLLMEGQLGDEEWVRELVSGAFTSIWETRASAHQPKWVAMNLLQTKMAHIGFVADRPATFIPGTTPEFVTLTNLFECDNTGSAVTEQIALYAVASLATNRVEKSGVASETITELQAAMDTQTAMDAFEFDVRLGMVREEVVAIVRTRGADNGGGGGGGIGGGSSLRVDSAAPKLEQLPKALDGNSQKFRHFLTWLDSKEKNLERTVVTDALVHHQGPKKTSSSFCARKAARARLNGAAWSKPRLFASGFAVARPSSMQWRLQAQI